MDRRMGYLHLTKILNHRIQKMQFTKKNNMYRISQVTGSQDNILGLCFSENNSSDIKVIQWNRKDDRKIQTSEDQVLEQVFLGLKEVNHSLGTSYRLSKIYFLPSESAADRVYKVLIVRLIRHYHSGNEFKEV